MTKPEPEPSAATQNEPPAPGGTDEATVWLVSFAEEDDRELRPPEIAEALRRGQINGETIVWREGLGDWAPLSTVSSLARLLPASGETAGLPPTGFARPSSESKQTPTVEIAGQSVPRTSGQLGASPAKPSEKIASGAKVAATPNEPAKPAVDPWKGKTRLGLPKVDPGAAKPVALTAKPVAAAAKPVADIAGPKKFEFKKVVSKAPEPKKAEGTPTTPMATSGTLPLPSVSAGSADAPPEEKPKTEPAAPAVAKNIWTDDDEEPISVDPESMRPRSPSPAPAHATALAAGTGSAGKPKPKPPTPKKAPRPPSPRTGESDSAEPTFQALASPLSTERADEDFMSLGGGTSALTAPAFDLGALTSEAEESSDGAFDLPLLVLPDATSETPAIEGTPTIPRGEVRKVAPSAITLPPKARPPAKKRSAAPFVLLGVAIVGGLAFALRGPSESPSPPPAGTTATEAPQPTDPKAEAPAVPATPTAVVEATPSASAEPPAPAASATPSAVAPEATHGAPPAPTTLVAASKKEPTPSAAPPMAVAKETKAPEQKAAPAPEPEQKEVDEGAEFDKSAAAAALATAVGEASGCRKDGDPSGVATVHVTFSNAGHATRATVEGPPFAGTATGGCIAAALRKTKVPPFGGDRVTVTKRVVIQ